MRAKWTQAGIKKETMMHFINNIDKYNSNEGMLENTILERQPNGDLKRAYQRFKFPMMSPREILIVCDSKELTGEMEGKTLWTMFTYEDPAYPIRKDAIRMSLFKAMVMWEEDGNVIGEEISTMDMGGYFPMRLLNMSLGATMKKQMAQQFTKLQDLQKTKEETGSFPA